LGSRPGERAFRAILPDPNPYLFETPEYCCMSLKGESRDKNDRAISQTLIAVLGIIFILVVASLFQFVLSPRLDAYRTGYQPNETLHPEVSGTPDPAIAAMLLQVNESGMYRTVEALQEIPTRAYGTPGNREAAEYLYGRLSAIPNVSVEFQGGELRNIIAVLPGQDEATGKVIIVGAHYDSSSSDPAHAPGVTDNGCGVAIVMDLARVMSLYHFQHTMEFALWNGEEGNGDESLLGSSSYARQAKNGSLDIPLSMNYDSSCYDPENRSVVDIIYNLESRPMAEEMVRSNTLYGINATLTYNLFHCYSDHRPFWSEGYPAIMTHSESHGFHHTPDDTIDKASFPYARKNARLGMAVLAHYAGITGKSS
jgi:hypothetical protein